MGFPCPNQTKVKFKVIKNPNIYGCFDEHEMEIQISSNALVGTFTTIFQTLLHEMVHLALYVRGDEDFHEHGPSIRKKKELLLSFWGVGAGYGQAGLGYHWAR
jgi:hypothetical protein